MNEAVTLKNAPTLALPELSVPVLKQAEDEEERSGNAMLEENVIGSRVPLIMLECNMKDKDSPTPTDGEDGFKKLVYVEYAYIDSLELTFNTFLPHMTFSINSEMEYNCKVGNKVYLCLVPFNKNTGHEKIKMQFLVTSIDKSGGHVSFSCDYYVDNQYNSYPIYSNDKSSYEIAMELTKEMQLGFKSNVDAIEDVAWYESNKQMLDSLANLSYGSELTDLFSVYIDEDNCFNLVNLYNIKTNIEDDFNFNLDVDTGTTDNIDFNSYTDMQLRLSNHKGIEILPTYIERFHKGKMSDGANTGDNFIFRSVKIDEYGMPTVDNSQLEYTESEGKTVLQILGEQTKEDVNSVYVEKEVLRAMRDKALNKLFADILILDTKYIYGLRKFQQVLVDIWQYDTLKKTRGKVEEDFKNDPEIDTDMQPVKDEVMTGQYLVLDYSIYYRRDKGHIRQRFKMFKIA